MKRLIAFGSVLLLQAAFAQVALAQTPMRAAPAGLTEAEKSRIREAVRPRQTPDAPPAVRSDPDSPPVSQPANAVATRGTGAPIPERISRAIAAHRELTQFVDRLMSKRAEIERWDELAQEKFHRTFGSTDEKVRQAVLARINQQLQESTRAMTALSESIRFEFYISLNKK